MVPGTRLHPEAQDDSIPVMLVQRTIGPQMADRSVRGSSEKGTVFGWTLIVPSGWGSAFWHSLAFADTRIGGLRERAQQYFEAGCHSFPDDYACTHAFKIEIDKKAKEAAGRWHRTPKAKRVNFDKLKTESPWRPHLTGITDVLEQELKDIIMLADDSAHQNENVRYLQKHEAKHAKSAPYLVGGMLVHQFLLKASSIIQAKDSLPQRTYRFVVSTYLQTLENIRAKRGLKPTGFRLLDAFVKVRMEPADRGSPKPNAIIYRFDACKPIPEAVEDSRNRKSKPCVGTKRKIDESVDKENVTVSVAVHIYSMDRELRRDWFQEYTFATPASNDIMGYVTSGNMSLKEGKGQGIGVVSLLMLIQLMETEGVTM